MVGVSLALALRQQLPAATRLLLVESFPLPTVGADFKSQYSASFDARSTALSYASCLIYEELGLWDVLRERACAIESVHVSERGRFGSTLLEAADYQWPALGYVIENAWLGNILIEALRQAGVDTLSPARVVNAQPQDHGMLLQLDSEEQLDCALLVVADGANSSLRDALGIEAKQQNYEQQALIANIGHAGPHAGRAFERFTSQGPMALLPLQAVTGETPRSALVWSLPSTQAEQLMSCEEDVFLASLQQQFGYRVGKMQRVGERHAYPLALVQSLEQARQGVVIMGNAAHSLHPVAGQGFNLALRDVARLARVLSAAATEGRSLGEIGVLQQYCEQQATDQQRTTAFSDQLPGLFTHGNQALGMLRDFGLFTLDLSPGLKREFVRHTAGLAPSAGYRNVQP